VECHMIENIPYTIPEKELLKRIDDRPSISISARLKKTIKIAVSDIRQHSRFKAIFGISDVDTENRHIVISDQTFNSRRLKKVLIPCHKTVVFITTIGEEIDRLIKKSMKRRSSYGYILDAAASVAVESATNGLMDHIENHYDGKVETTYRYSPGYCDWALREQQKLFHLLPHKRIGVDLSDSYLMTPRKSISGIAGLCRASLLKNGGNACADCPRLDCPYRRRN